VGGWEGREGKGDDAYSFLRGEGRPCVTLCRAVVFLPIILFNAQLATIITTAVMYHESFCYLNVNENLMVSLTC
jgi:hypothetical protein